MKRVLFRTLEPQDRFLLDDQWWIKTDSRTAKHASYDTSIDLKPASSVQIRGEEEDKSISLAEENRMKARKREGFFLLLGTLLESFNW